jgi:uncharacterized metal-binding protein
MADCRTQQARPTVALLGCSGIGQLMSTVVRRACFRVAERHPEVVLLSVGALTGDVEEVLEQGRNLPVVLVDGCREHCGTVLGEAKGLNVVSKLFAIRLVEKDHMRLAGENRAHLGAVGLAAVEDVARGISAEIARLQDEMLSAEEVA